MFYIMPSAPAMQHHTYKQPSQYISQQLGLSRRVLHLSLLSFRFVAAKFSSYIDMKDKLCRNSKCSVIYQHSMI